MLYAAVPYLNGIIRPTTRTLCVTTLVVVVATVGAGDAVGVTVGVGEAVGVSEGTGVMGDAVLVGEGVVVGDADGVDDGVGLDESEMATEATGPDASAELARVVAEMIPAHSAMAVLAATTRAADVLI